MKQNEQLQQPFFAKLLEAQQVIPKKENQEPYPTYTYLVIDGYQTMKYPSDGDDDGPKI